MEYFVTYRERKKTRRFPCSLTFLPRRLIYEEIFSRVDYETPRRKKKRLCSTFLPFLPSSLFFSIFFYLLLLLLLQKFRLPGKSWDPIIRVSSIVMQITITNRRQGRSPDDIAGKESWWIPSTRGRILFSTWHPGSPRGSLEDRGSEKKVVARFSSTGRSTSSTRVLLLDSLQLTIKILVTSSSSLRARVTCTTVSFKNIVGEGRRKIVVLIRVEKKYEVDGGGGGDGSRSYFVEIDGGYILFREISGGGGEKSLEIAKG